MVADVLKQKYLDEYNHYITRLQKGYIDDQETLLEMLSIILNVDEFDKFTIQYYINL